MPATVTICIMTTATTNVEILDLASILEKMSLYRLIFICNRKSTDALTIYNTTCFYHKKLICFYSSNNDLIHLTSQTNEANVVLSGTIFGRTRISIHLIIIFTYCNKVAFFLDIIRVCCFCFKLR